MTALSDRYVHAVLRALPGRQRVGLEPDIRALVADTVDARQGDERAALIELGRPSVLASRYADGPQYLVGPAVFGEWRRILTLLVPIVVTLAAAVTGAANLIGGSTFVETLAMATGMAISAAIQTVFWVTVVFAFIERATTQQDIPGSAGATWTPDDLPELPDDGRISATDVVTDLVSDVILLGALVWLSLSPRIVIDGVAFTLFNPAIWSLWLPWFLVVAALSVVLTVARSRHGRWTLGFAAANAGLNASFAIPALYLLVNGMLFDPELVEEVTAVTGDAWLSPAVTITAVVIAIIVAWDAIDGFLKARRAAASRGREVS
jgi:hypothetical protein